MVLAILRKEFLEIVGDRQSLRGTGLQSMIFFGICGVFTPWRSGHGEIWGSLSLMLTLYALLPTVIATSIAADAFAGELERGTLESLLATAVTDTAVFWGKALTAVAMSLTLSAVCVLSAIFITLHVHQLPPQIVNSRVLALVFLGHIAASTCLTAIAIYASAKLKVARAAQQALSIGSLLGIFGLTAAGPYLELSGWSRIAAGEALLLLAGGVALVMMARFFRRDRIFEGS